MNVLPTHRAIRMQRAPIESVRTTVNAKLDLMGQDSTVQVYIYIYTIL